MSRKAKYCVIIHETVSYTITVEAADSDDAIQRAVKASKTSRERRKAKTSRAVPFVSRFQNDR